MGRKCGSKLLYFCILLHRLIVEADVLCPAPVIAIQTNASLEVNGHPGNYLLISCSRGCCPESSDGCCYRNTEDVVVYTVPVSVFLVLIIIILCCIFKRLRNNRRLDQLEQDKAAADVFQDSPPSYSACVHPVSSTSTLALSEVHETVEIVIHPPPAEEENTAVEDPPPPPPVYDDIFKYGEEDQVTVVSPSGRVSFVDLTLLPAIKSSLSNNDLHGKMGKSGGSSRSLKSLGQGSSRSLKSLGQGSSRNLQSLGHQPNSFKTESTIELNEKNSGDESNTNTLKGCTNDDSSMSGSEVQEVGQRVLFSLGCTDSFRSTRGETE